MPSSPVKAPLSAIAARNAAREAEAAEAAAVAAVVTASSSATDKPRKKKKVASARATSSLRRPDPREEEEDDVDEGKTIDTPTAIFQPVWKGEHANVAQKGSTVIVALPPGQAMAFRGIVQVRVRHGAAVVQGATLTTSSASAVLLAPSRHVCPAPIAIEPSYGSSSELAADFRKLLPGSTTDCCVLELSQASDDVRSIENFGRVFPVPGEEIPFGFKDGTDLLFEAGVPFLPGFRLIGAATMDSALSPKVDVVELPPSWRSAVQAVLPEFASRSSIAKEVPDTDTAFARALVRGPRGVGKSLFARTLLNAALTTQDSEWSAVAFLDLDLGQTEFGPPGLLSLNIFSVGNTPSASSLLIGPPWTTIRRPVRAHFIGETTPKNVPRAYMEAAADLVAFYKQHVEQGYAPLDTFHGQSLSGGPEVNGIDLFESRSRKRRRLGTLPDTDADGDVSPSSTSFIPLIVNTQGWVSGLGADLLSELQSLLQPSHIFDFTPQIDVQQQEMGVAGVSKQAGSARTSPPDSTGEKEDAPSPPQIIFVPASTAAVGPTAQSRLRLTAVDQRALMLLSYLHAESLPSYSTSNRFAPTWNFGLPLTAIPPLMVNVRDGLLGGIHILPFGAAVEEKLRLHALNGSVVALVEQRTIDSNLMSLGDEDGADGTGIASIAKHVDPREIWRASFLSPVPKPATSRCLGLAVVRSISRDRHELQLLGPLRAMLADQRGSSSVRNLALVKGAIDLPAQAALDFESIEYLRRPHLLQASSSASARPEVKGDEGGPSDDDDEMDGEGLDGGEGPSGTVNLSGRTIHGVPVEQIPYLEWPSDDLVTVAGGRKRRVRRNLQRRAH
ncbi:unnamed protein product [Tilletia caries]|nr:unnamed protein product [Tilletia caries]